jgi:predicted GNAT family acetyltransferase
MHTPTPIAHDEAGARFVLMIDGHLAHTDYVLEGGRMICTHTFVPPELCGRGLAEQLVRAALTEARLRGWRVVPACSYVAAFFQRHPEFGDLLA